MDKKYLKNLYNNNVNKIYKFFYFKVFDKQIAEDLTSETFLGFAEYLKNDSEIQNPEGLLYRIGVNIFNQHLRRKYIETNIPIDDLDYINGVSTYTENFDNSKKIIKLISRYIDQLPKKQRVVLKMRLVERKSLSIIAEELKKDMNYVKTTQKRGIAKIKKLLETDSL